MIKDWLKQSNRLCHLAAGFLISIGGFLLGPWASLYGACCAAAALEAKDHAYGNKVDLIDILMTICGAIPLTIVQFIL